MKIRFMAVCTVAFVLAPVFMAQAQTNLLRNNSVIFNILQALLGGNPDILNTQKSLTIKDLQKQAEDLGAIIEKGHIKNNNGVAIGSDNKPLPHDNQEKLKIINQQAIALKASEKERARLLSEEKRIQKQIDANKNSAEQGYNKARKERLVALENKQKEIISALDENDKTLGRDRKEEAVNETKNEIQLILNDINEKPKLNSLCITQNRKNIIEADCHKKYDQSIIDREVVCENQSETIKNILCVDYKNGLGNIYQHLLDECIKPTKEKTC